MKIFCVVNHADHVDRRHYFEKQNLIIQSNVLAIILGIISTIQPELDASCDTFHAEVAGNTKGTRNFNKGFLRSPYKGKASSSRKFLLEAKKNHLIYVAAKLVTQYVLSLHQFGFRR